MVGSADVLAYSQQFTEVSGEGRVEARVMVTDDFQGDPIVGEDMSCIEACNAD